MPNAPNVLESDPTAPVPVLNSASVVKGGGLVEPTGFQRETGTSEIMFELTDHSFERPDINKITFCSVNVERRSLKSSRPISIPPRRGPRGSGASPQKTSDLRFYKNRSRGI